MLYLSVNDDMILMPPVERADPSPSLAQEPEQGRREKAPRSGRPSTRSPLRAARKRTIRRSILIVVAVIVLALGWVTVRGGMAVAAAADGVGAATRLGPLLTNQDAPGARTEVERISAKAEEVRALTSDPVWRAVEFVPFLGSNFTTVREAVGALDIVAREALPPVVDLASAVSFSGIEGRDRSSRLADLALASGPLSEIKVALAKASQRVADVDPTMNIAPLADGFGKVRSSLQYYASAAEGLQGLSSMAPSLETPGSGGSWVVTVTARDEHNVQKPVAFLKGSTADQKFSVSEIIDAGSGSVPEPGAAGNISVDAATLELLTDQLGTMTVAGVGDIPTDKVAGFVSRGAYSQAPTAADAEKWIGAFAATVLARALN